MLKGCLPVLLLVLTLGGCSSESTPTNAPAPEVKTQT